MRYCPARARSSPIGGHEGCIAVGLYEDGQPGEIFITMAQEGSTKKTQRFLNTLTGDG